MWRSALVGGLLTLLLSWDPNTEPTLIGYAVSWWDAKAPYYVYQLGNGLATQFSFTEPDATRSYCFTVRAYTYDQTVGLQVSPDSATVCSIPGTTTGLHATRNVM